MSRFSNQGRAVLDDLFPSVCQIQRGGSERRPGSRACSVPAVLRFGMRRRLRGSRGGHSTGRWDSGKRRVENRSVHSLFLCMPLTLSITKLQKRSKMCSCRSFVSTLGSSTWVEAPFVLNYIKGISLYNSCLHYIQRKWAWGYYVMRFRHARACLKAWVTADVRRTKDFLEVYLWNDAFKQPDSPLPNLQLMVST